MKFDRGITLRTERLVLRPHRAQDVPDAVAAARDPQMRTWMAWAPRQTPEQALAYCTDVSHRDPEHKIDLAVEAAGRMSGAIGLERADWQAGRVEIGYWIAPWARRRGYAVEAVLAMVRYAFGKGLHRVELLAAPGNLASQRVAERAGFTREAVLREAGVTPAGRTDMIMYGLVEGDLECG